MLMVLWGTLASQFERQDLDELSNWRLWILNFTGIGLALYVFMADALRAFPGGVEALRQLLPVTFNWPLFTVALLLMSAPVIRLAMQLWSPAGPGAHLQSPPDP
jgi:hypothetical protein